MESKSESTKPVDNIPKRITEDQYDKLMRRLWEIEQRLVGAERASSEAVSLDMVFDRQHDIEIMLTAITKRINLIETFKLLETKINNLETKSESLLINPAPKLE